jgi:anti-sigma factor RsiW
MPKMPQLEIEDKANWQVMVEQAMQAAVRGAIARVLDEELAAAWGPAMRGWPTGPAIATARRCGS